MDEIGAKLIEEAKQIIQSDKNNPNGMKNIQIAMNKVYRHFKSPEIHSSVDFDTQVAIFSLEQLMRNDFLPLETKPDFNPKKKPKFPRKIKDEKDCEQFVKGIVHLIRENLSKHNDLENDTLEAQCINSSFVTSRICEKLGLSQKDFWCSTNLSTGTFHCFNIVSFDIPNGETKKYIVDCTYRQFFTYADSFLERLGVMTNSGCCMGRYILMDENRKKTAETLLKQGFIEMTPENVKNYFDGFVFQGRNGAYYENLGKKQLSPADYSPEYTAEEYLSALIHDGLPKEQEWSNDKCKNPSSITFDYTSPEKPNLIAKIRGFDSTEYPNARANTPAYTHHSKFQNKEHTR